MANLSGYNFAYLDEQTKRMIRRAIMKAVAIPGYQVPFGGREMPMPYGWGHRRHSAHRQRDRRSGCAKGYRSRGGRHPPTPCRSATSSSG
ncbi:Phosphonate metabolism protein PhnJ [Kluyvera cryocrescens]|uniref:Phosphonate metabolism protein PhnJ n=1 Tax=Kluyvera cryocrescens TaxID=580 RepID=A0A485A9N6_KLUCR|nr:Phosphonate metabolism protein PhnJ [Kluyvera cryocrescens]